MRDLMFYRHKFYANTSIMKIQLLAREAVHGRKTFVKVHSCTSGERG